MKQKPIEIKITITPDNKLNVTGFPTNLEVTLNYMFKATTAIVEYFMQKAVDGKLVKDESRIIQAKFMPKDISKLIH